MAARMLEGVGFEEKLGFEGSPEKGRQNHFLTESF
jgi:hypothetical protein